MMTRRGTTNLRSLGLFSTLAFVLSGAPALSLADDAPEKEKDKGPAWQEGPVSAQLGSQAIVQVPKGFAFTGAEGARQLLERMGNRTNGSEVGLVTSTAADADWFVIFENRQVGYVTDDDHNTIDADAILSGISEGTEAANDERKEQGFPALHVTGWFEKPHYSETTNNLVWAIEAKEDGSSDRVVNYNVRLLGRDGFMSVTLVAAPDQVQAVKPELDTILGGFTYIPGKRYAEFLPGDRLAGYGLAALVAGGAGAAAAKLGLFAKLGVVLVKAWKLLVVGGIALASAVRRLFGGRRTTSE